MSSSLEIRVVDCRAPTCNSLHTPNAARLIGRRVGEWWCGDLMVVCGGGGGGMVVVREGLARSHRRSGPFEPISNGMTTPPTSLANSSSTGSSGLSGEGEKEEARSKKGEGV